MIMLRAFFTCVALALLTQPTLAESFSLTGENTKIKFVGTKKNGSHSGGFKKLTGKASTKSSDAETLSLSVVIDVDSMYTDADKLTAHLKSPDFFEVKRYPDAKFESTEVKLTKSGHVVTGNLTMHGQTKKLSFPADITIAPDSLKVAAKFKLDRNTWGISYGKGMIEDEVAMEINVAAKK